MFAERVFDFARSNVFQLENITFCKVENAFSKHCVFKHLMGVKTAFCQNSTPFSLSFHVLFERDS